jgi:amino acid transporter
MIWWKQLFTKKPLAQLLAEAEGDNRLRRVLGKIGLTSLGVGAIIGAGIFVMTGRVAAQDAGPAILLSFVVSGVGCLFAAMCYSEFASMAPVAGSAYTYAYTTIGELLAWIIGWDLVLEYAMACACVAASWAKYFNAFLNAYHFPIVPDYLMHDPFSPGGAWLNLPAALITLAVTVVLVIGIKESATTNAVLVGIKVGVILFVIFAGIAFVNPSNWTGIPARDRIRAEEQLAPILTQETRDTVEKVLGEIDGLPGDVAVRAELSRQLQNKLWGESRTYIPVPDKQDASEGGEEAWQKKVEEIRKEWGKKADERTKLLTFQVLALFNKKSAEAEGETPAEVQERLIKARQKRLKAAVDSELKQWKITEAEDLAKKEAIDKEQETDLPKTAEDKTVANAILVAVEKKAPEKATEKWGLLGHLGINKWLVPIDNTIRGPFAPYGLAGIIFGASIVFFAYIGFDAISTHAEEARNPKYDVPFAILGSLAICTVLYIGVAAVITGMVPYHDIDPEAAVSTAFLQKAATSNNVMLRYAGGLIAAGGLAGMTSVLLITFLSQARIFLAMARDGLLPPAIFGAIHPRFRTPHISTMLTGGIIAVVAAFTPILALEEMVSIGTLMAFVIVCAAVLLLRYQSPNAERPFRTPMLWLVAPLGILVNLIMMLFLPIVTWLRLVVWLVVGLAIYFGYGMWNSTLRHPAPGGPSPSGHGGEGPHLAPSTAGSPGAHFRSPDAPAYTDPPRDIDPRVKGKD